MRPLRPTLVGILLLASLTACVGPAPAPTTSSDASGSAPPPPSTTATAPEPSATTGPSSASASTSAGTGASSDPDRPSGQCPDAVIRVSLSMPKGAAGSFGEDVVFTNSGASSCVLRGTPGLSVVGGGNGTQLGAAAARDRSAATTVRLAAHGGQVYAPFSGPELGPATEGAKHCSGGVRSGDGYRVYPPHSTRAVFVRDGDALACPTGGAFLRVGVVRPVGTP